MRVPADPADLVLLIHGTFAGHADDEGHRWWQQGSSAWDELNRRLPAGVQLPEQGEVFHWSGDNSERARIKAGQDLLERLLEMESTGRGYHLIGHSHGGSVIWHALRLATLKGQPLHHLKSWSTVGTPFLHYRTLGALSPANLINLALSLILLKPAYTVFVGFFGFALSALLGASTTLDLRSDEEAGLIMALFRAPLLKVVGWAGVPVSTTETGMRVGSFDPTSEQTMLGYLFGSWEGWVITLVILFGGYSVLLLASLFLNPVLESLRIRAEQRLERKALQTYRGRWLGLWSTSDEAINGLRATLDLSISFVNQIAPRERVLLSDYLSLLSQPYRWLLAPAFNRLLRPWLDGFVRSLVIKTAQGNNRPAAEVVAVSPYPAADANAHAHPALPATLDVGLVEQANSHSRDIAPKLRELLAQPSFVAGLERFGQALSGHELIHTSYFDHAAILDLLSLHLSWACLAGQPLPLSPGMPPQHVAWFCEFKRSVQEEVHLVVAPPRASEPAPLIAGLVRPRRRVIRSAPRRNAA